MTELENIDVVHVLADTFYGTRDYDYLDSAIAITKEIIAVSSAMDVRKILEPLLDNLLEIKSEQVMQTVEEPLLDMSSSVDDSTTHTMATDLGNTDNDEDVQYWENLNIARALVVTFRDTGDWDYFDTAIALLQETVSANFASDLQSLLNTLLEIRSDRASLPVQKTVIIESTNHTHQIPTPNRGLHLMQTIVNACCDTHNSYHLDKAIAVMPGMISAGTRTGDRELHHLMDALSLMKSILLDTSKHRKVMWMSEMLLDIFWQTGDHDDIDNDTAFNEEQLLC